MKNYRFWRYLFTFSSLIFLFLCLAPEAPRASAQARDIRFGVVEAFWEPEAAYESGAGWERILFYWNELQPNGPDEWNSLHVPDEWLFEARRAGREIVGLVKNTPAWATDGEPFTGVPRGLYLPVDDPGNLWANFIRQLVSYYAPRGVDHWVIWNEPDIATDVYGHEWGGTIEDYYQLVKVAYLAAREVNPNVQIHLAGVTYYHDSTWFDRFLDVVVADPTAPANNYYFDVATLHLYFVSDRVYTVTANHFYAMEQHGFLRPVWINETNARPGIDPEQYPPDLRFAGFPNVTMGQQASFIIQSFALGFAAGAERIAVYKLSDGVMPETDPQAWGLVRLDGSYRPAFRAYQVVTEQFSGFVYARRVQLELADYVRLTHTHKVTHVAWSRTAQPVMLAIPARSQQATLIDQAGNEEIVFPQDGVYRLSLPGADCDDPVSGCIIGGWTYLLVEDGLVDPLNEPALDPYIEVGLESLEAARTGTPEVTEELTPTPMPTLTPLPTETPLPSPTFTLTPPPTVPPPPPPTPTPLPLSPSGAAASLPLVLVGAGALILGGTLGYWLSTRRGSQD